MVSPTVSEEFAVRESLALGNYALLSRSHLINRNKGEEIHSWRRQGTTSLRFFSRLLLSGSTQPTATIGICEMSPSLRELTTHQERPDLKVDVWLAGSTTSGLLALPVFLRSYWTSSSFVFESRMDEIAHDVAEETGAEGDPHLHIQRRMDDIAEEIFEEG